MGEVWERIELESDSVTSVTMFLPEQRYVYPPKKNSGYPDVGDQPEP
jgi:hypothetical protein